MGKQCRLDGVFKVGLLTMFINKLCPEMKYLAGGAV